MQRRDIDDVAIDVRFPAKTCRSNDRIGAIGKDCVDFDIAVCSHNELPVEEAMTRCTRNNVVEERQFIRDLRNAILAEFEKGTGFMEIPKAVRLPQYSHMVGYEEWLEMNTLRLMTDLWMGPFPWMPDAQ
jgi:hypothetical protein